jgi:hypothetical protein
MFRAPLKVTTIVFSGLIMSACGGGDGSTSTGQSATTTNTNSQPLAQVPASTTPANTSNTTNTGTTSTTSNGTTPGTTTGVPTLITGSVPTLTPGSVPTLTTGSVPTLTGTGTPTSSTTITTTNTPTTPIIVPTTTVPSTSSGSSGSTSTTLAASGGGAVTMSTEDLPYRDPKPLQDLMALNDADFQNQLTDNWPYVGNLIDQYIPPNVTLYPVALGFYGPMASCRQYHGLLACREFMAQLIGLMTRKAP